MQCLFTHHHADHCHGIDDLRAFCQINKKQIPLYGNQFSMDELNKKFQYAMVEPNGFWETPILKPNIINEPFNLFGLAIETYPCFSWEISNQWLSSWKHGIPN